MTADITVLDYRPCPTLDEELAELIRAAVAGWPDDQAITASLVRSMLRPVGLTATTLALHRDAAGILMAAAALRWPATLEASGCLWGPMVRPVAGGAGVATALLEAVAGIMATHPGVRVTTSGIPESRTAGWGLFERAGWQGAGTAHLLTRSLIAAELVETAGVRSVRAGEYLDQRLAALVAGARPELGYATARDTYARWSADARYRPDGLLVAEDGDVLLGAALVYPSPPGGGEQVEALIAELVTAVQLDASAAAAVRGALVAAALRAGAAVGASRVRAIVDSRELVATMLAAGFEVIERYRYYTQDSPAHQVAVFAGSGAYASA